MVERNFIVLGVGLLIIIAAVSFFYPIERSVTESPTPSVCMDGETRNATCPDGVTTYLNENCVNGEWHQVMYIRDPCETISTPEPEEQEITSFEECIDAGNPAMESYPRKCRDPKSDRTFTEELRQICTEEEKKAEICTMDYNPVCGEIGLNTGKTTYKTFSNVCNACSSMKVVGYTSGKCEDKLFVVCDGGAKMFDPIEYAQSNDGLCVDRCPEDFDPFTTQIGIQLCIPHYSEAEIEQWDKCEKSTDNCKCAKAYETTDEKQIENAEYRCVPDKYAERLLFRGGLDSLDENGEQSVMIA